MKTLREIVEAIRYDNPIGMDGAARQAMGDAVWRLSVLAPEILDAIDAARDYLEEFGGNGEGSDAALDKALKALDQKVGV